MNVCVYELGSMSGARKTLFSRISHYRDTIDFSFFFFLFTKEAHRISKCNIQWCVCVFFFVSRVVCMCQRERERASMR